MNGSILQISSSLPDYEHRVSSLRKAYVLTELKWKNYKKKVRGRRYENICELVKILQQSDGAPGLEALEKMVDFYVDKGIDILKDTVSILGMSYNYIIKGAVERAAEFYSAGAEEYEMLKQG